MTSPVPPASPVPSAALPAVPFAEAFLYWLKLGFISFGGPAGQIALMHAELVDKRRWISEQRFLHALNYCMILPGPEATQLAIYIGWLMHRTWGGIVAGILFLLPSILILCGISWIYLAYGNVPAVAGILYGIKPAVVAVVLAAAWRIGSRTLNNGWLAAIAILAFIAIAVLHLPFPAIILAAGLIGMTGARFLPGRFGAAGQTHAAAGASGPALIGDDTPTPAHARFSWKKLMITSGAGIVIAVLAWAALAALVGREHAYAKMGWFFTKAALLTFGGAYAVLPYIYQGAVETYHWVTPAQMMDGLALGETTPGPLIMIVAFVGFVGGWSGQLFGQDSLLAAGMLGGGVAAFFTFFPSFVFILAGGPVVESTRDNIRLTAPLTAISAAVVGVIVSLAVFFARHVFHLDAAPAQWDAVAIAIAAVACVALMRFKMGTIPLLACCAAAGLLLSR